MQRDACPFMLYDTMDKNQVPVLNVKFLEVEA